MRRITTFGLLWTGQAATLLAQEPSPGSGAGNWPWLVLASGVVGIIVGYGIAVAMWKGKSSWSNCNKICTQHGTYCDRDTDHGGSHHCPNGHDF